jgi:hypothetical protein
MIMPENSTALRTCSVLMGVSQGMNLNSTGGSVTISLGRAAVRIALRQSALAFAEIA